MTTNIVVFQTQGRKMEVRCGAGKVIARKEKKTKPAVLICFSRTSSGIPQLLTGLYVNFVNN